MSEMSRRYPLISLKSPSTSKINIQSHPFGFAASSFGFFKSPFQGYGRRLEKSFVHEDLCPIDFVCRCLGCGKAQPTSED